MASPLGYDGGLTVSIGVRDRQVSMRWYQEMLGFKLLYEVDEIGWCELATEVDRVNVGLSEVEEVRIGGPVPTFGVRDIDAARERLEAHDVEFDGPTRTYEGMVRLATFYDPDGHALMLYQDLQRQGG